MGEGVERRKAGNLLRTLRGHSRKCLGGAADSPYGKWLATASGLNKTAKLWEA